MDDAVARFLAALERADLDALAATLAPDVRFRSPITNSARFEGKETVVELYRSVLDTLSDVEARQVAAEGDLRVLHGTARAGGRVFEETTLVHLDADGRIRELALFVRDLPALTALAAGLGPRVARRHARWRAPIVAVMAWPLALLTRLGDRLAARAAGVA